MSTSGRKFELSDCLLHGGITSYPDLDKHKSYPYMYTEFSVLEALLNITLFGSLYKAVRWVETMISDFPVGS